MSKVSHTKSKEKIIPKEKEDAEGQSAVKIIPKTPVDKELQNNRLAINNSFTIFDQRYDPMIYSSISFKRQTTAGSIIPRINYSNRLGKHGIQYDLDFYPKFSKRLYAYINYGHSKASIYPNHKVGGDLYVNLPGAIEFSAGGRFINTDTQNISVITNSLGYYRGNYYFSLRSYITPRPEKLTRVSGNILVRKYLKDAENFLGVNVGMGISPELRQLTSGDELLAETFLYIESQRLRFEYQFTGKKSSNVYRANLGVARQELAFDSGNFFWGVSTGITYQVKF
jgi:YaiO family outer membrane protein